MKTNAPSLVQYLHDIQVASIEVTILSSTVAFGIAVWQPASATRLLLSTLLLIVHVIASLFLVFARSL